MPLDLSSLGSVRAAAKLIAETTPHLDVLIHNAGIMMTPHQLTEDGHEAQLATNHLGPWLLTNLLRPVLTGRVVFVSSVAHRACPFRFEDPCFASAPYSPFLAYAQSKTACVLDAAAFTVRGLPAVALHPGGIRTNLGRHITQEELAGRMGRFFDQDGAMKPDSGWAFKTLAQGAATTIVAAFDPALRGGEYLDDCGVAPVVGPARDMAELAKGGVAQHALGEEDAERLWALSEEMVGETF